MRSLACAAALWCAFVSSASAQDTEGARAEDPALACEEGRQSVEGRCCWPGQTWSTEHARCDGRPSCPSALVEHGETCVARTVVTAEHGVSRLAPPTDLDVPDAYHRRPARLWPSIESLRLGGPVSRPTITTGEDEGLIIASLVVIDIGFVLGAIIGIVDQLAENCASFGSVPCNSGPLSLIPLGGGIASGLMQFQGFRTSSTLGLIAGPISVIFQGVGLIMLAISMANETTELGFQPIVESEDATFSIEPAAPGADLGGLSSVLRF